MDGILLVKLTDIDLAQWACSMTVDHESNMSLKRLYRNEHSPMRTQIFKIGLYGIPTFVSTHLVRHSVGIIGHFVKTQRDDRIGETEGTSPDRWTPTNHGILCNAQALVNMARKRLCYKSHIETVKVMQELKHEVAIADPDLAIRMVPECIYRGGVCHEDKMCRLRPGIRHWKEIEINE